ncbi:MAG: M1 family metallopeptidase [archaeon]
MKREFKYYPEDFAPLPVNVCDMDLIFDIYDKHTVVSSHLTLETIKEIKEISLDANNLEILKAECLQFSYTYIYKKEENKLIIKFEKKVPISKKIVIHTESICRPTKNLLEGLYYDETPKGAPPTQITQCQQWGFQRLVPCIDDMTAKCTYITKIVADSRYTHMITNGDIIQEKTSVENNRSQIVYSNTKTPMAPYLFFLCVGTYESFTREFEYPDGKKFNLELLVPPDSDKNGAEAALDILFYGIMWIHLFTGEKKYEDTERKKRIFSMVEKREAKKQKGLDYSKEADELKSLVTGIKLGYQYTGTVYREIAMQNSNFGGMENVGNTTITANKIMPSVYITDAAFEYMMRVKAHEFYHNINGSEVTGKSPFEIWLNEAVTCHIEREYHAFIAGKNYARLGEVARIVAPVTGTLEEDSGTISMPIIPKGFNNPDELISNVTYSKAPEFVRMIEEIIGKEAFAKGLALYHERFKHGNASTADWLAAMEEVSGKELSRMANVWLTHTGFPIVAINKEFSDNCLKLHLKQSGFKEENYYEFPFSAALYDKTGKLLKFQKIWMQKVEETIVFSGVINPTFISFCQGYLFYGKIDYNASDEELFLQVKLDPDYINRFLAMQKLFDKEKTRLFDNADTLVDERLIDLYFLLLSDESVIKETGGMLLGITASVEDRKKAHEYEKLYLIKKKILLAIALKYKKELIGLYNKKRISIQDDSVKSRIASIKCRQAKNTCLSILSELDSPDIHKMILSQFMHSQCATDQYHAFGLYIKSSAKEKAEIIENYEKEAAKNLVSFEAFLSAIGSNESEDAINTIKKIEKSKYFRIDQSNDQRALLVRFALNKRKSLLTEEGRQYLKEIIIKLSKINEYNTGHILGIFSKLDDFNQIYYVPIMELLVECTKKIDKNKVPSVYNTIKRLIKGASLASKAYEEKYKKMCFD